MHNINGFDFYKLIEKKVSFLRICFISSAEYTEEKIKNRLSELKMQNHNTITIRKPIRLKELSPLVNIIINGESE